MEQRERSQKQGWMTTGFSLFCFLLKFDFFLSKIYFELNNYTYIIFHKNNKVK